MIIFVASLLTIGVLVYILSVRARDLPQPEPVSPFEHLDERKAAIYENLRDLQFEYRVGKLSDQDYQQTKQDLQKELAGVLAEIDKVKQTLASQATAAVQTINLASNPPLQTINLASNLPLQTINLASNLSLQTINLASNPISNPTSN